MLKFWIIPMVTFWIFVCFAIATLFYAYSDLNLSTLSPEESNSSVMSMQEFQGAMSSKLK